MQDKRNEILALEKRLVQKEESLDRRLSNFDRREAEFQKREKTVAVREKALEEKEADVARLIQDHTKALEYASGMTADEATASLLQQAQSAATLGAGKTIMPIPDAP